MRTHEVEVYLSATEKDDVSYIAETLGVGMSTALRMIAIEKAAELRAKRGAAA